MKNGTVYITSSLFNFHENGEDYSLDTVENFYLGAAFGTELLEMPASYTAVSVLAS